MKYFDAIIGKTDLPTPTENANTTSDIESDALIDHASSENTSEAEWEESDMSIYVTYVPENREEEGARSMSSSITLTRRQIYDEIWEISVAGMAKKYDIPYIQLMKRVKEAQIPIPPSGYWTKLSFGKPVTKIELSEPFDDEVSIICPGAPPIRIEKSERITNKLKSGNEPFYKNEEAEESPESTHSVNLGAANVTASTLTQQAAQEPETIEKYGQTYNVYNRKTLYKEVWESPVIDVAKRYKVSDATIHKVCKALDIPKPPSGYWAKLRAGKPATIIPLPTNEKPSLKIGIQTGMNYQPVIELETLAYINNEDRNVILSIAAQILLPGENERMHPKITAHRRKVLEWKKNQNDKKSKVSNRRSPSDVPFLAEGISDDMIPRACRMIDALIRAMEPLGHSLADDLSFNVNGERVSLSFSESQDQVLHTLSKEENMQLLKYEEERKRYSWASKPQIRKYDYIYNGKLSLAVAGQKGFRDCKSYVLENRLGDIMIQMYEAAESHKKAREAREEAERKRQEEERRKEAQQKRYNVEVDQTLALTRLAEDYEIACRIRRYVEAFVESGSMSAETVKWVEWAKSKADWYDPTVAREDDLLGKRDHAQSEDKKGLRQKGYWWQ